ncbi:hypothetical protein WG66_008813, partial [Moniliophthora roreri]
MLDLQRKSSMESGRRPWRQAEQREDHHVGTRQARTVFPTLHVLRQPITGSVGDMTKNSFIYRNTIYNGLTDRTQQKLLNRSLEIASELQGRIIYFHQGLTDRAQQKLLNRSLETANGLQALVTMMSRREIL